MVTSLGGSAGNECLFYRRDLSLTGATPNRLPNQGFGLPLAKAIKAVA